jgi:hypothetical protein
MEGELATLADWWDRFQHADMEERENMLRPPEEALKKRKRARGRKHRAGDGGGESGATGQASDDAERKQ